MMICQQRTKDWQQRHPERIEIYNKNHQKKKHKISKKEWEDCKKYFNYTCAYCGLSYNDHKIKYRQDLHKEHFDDNGANDLSNCIPSCKSCNSEKGELEFGEWYNNSSKYNEERLNKIMRWLNNDYKLYIGVPK